MTDNPLLTAALSYAALGWHIFPCAPGGKTPLLKGKGCRDASADPDQVRTWWTATPNANIGLACGKDSGVSVIDLDVDPDKGEDGWETLKEFPDLPDTVIAESPRGGAHFIFTTDDPPANKNDFASGIDIRGDGYYIVLAPSVHPNGKEYRWRAGHSPWDISPAPYPDFMRPVKKEVQPIQPVRPVTMSPSRTPIEERARLYLQECDPAISGAGGHSRLLWAARAMVKGFLLPESTAMYLLESEYNPRCTPPWNLADPREAKDFRRKVSEASRTYSQKPEGWLLDEFHLRSYWSDNSELLAAGNQIAANLLTPDPDTVTTEDELPEEPNEPEIESWLLNPPGLVGEVCKWINSTSMRLQPLLTLGAALTFCGALMGRKVKDEWNNRTNIYAMSVAPSSAGKEHARSQIKRLCAATGIDDLLGGEDVTSDAALEARLEKQPVTFFLWDEIGHMLQGIKNAGHNPHLGKVLPTLMKLYSSAGSLYIGKQYASGDANKIDQPCCCLYGTSTPEKLTDGISPSEIKDGFLGRVLVFISNQRPKKDFGRAANMEIPADLMEAVRAWAEYTPVPPKDAGNVQSVTASFQVVVPTTPEAQERFLTFEERAEAYMDLSENKSKGIDALWGKAGENARKIALILASGNNPHSPQIDECHADYACQLISFLIRQLSDLIGKNVAESQFEKDKQYLLKIIKDAGPRGITKSNLTRRTQKFDPRQRNSYLTDLIDSEEVVVQHSERTSIYYPYPYGLKT